MDPAQRAARVEELMAPARAKRLAGPREEPDSEGRFEWVVNDGRVVDGRWVGDDVWKDRGVYLVSRGGRIVWKSDLRAQE